MEALDAAHDSRTKADDELLDTEEAARRIGCSPGYLAKLRQIGGGPDFHRLFIRKGVRYDAREIAVWKADRRFGSTSEYPEATR